MTPYILFIVMTIVFSILYDGREDSPHKRFWYGFVCLYLVLLAGLRFGVGGDTFTYREMFEYYPTQQHEYGAYIMDEMFEKNFMPGWSILNIVCRQCFDSFYMVQIIQALIVNICIFYLFKQYTKHIFLCVLLYGLLGYFFWFNTEIMREGLAIGICGIAMHQYTKGNKITFLLLTLLAIVGFHTSAALVLLFPFCNFKNISIRTIVICNLCALVAWVISDLIMTHLLDTLTGEFALIGKIFSYGNLKSSFNGFIANSFRFFICQAGVMYFVLSSENIEEEKLARFKQYMGFFMVVSIVVCAFPGTIRLFNYAVIFFLIILADFLFAYKIQLKALPIFKTICLVGCLFFSLRFYMGYSENVDKYSYARYIPYVSIFNEDADVDYRYAMWEEAQEHELTEKNSRDY